MWIFFYNLMLVSIPIGSLSSTQSESFHSLPFKVLCPDPAHWRTKQFTKRPKLAWGSPCALVSAWSESLVEWSILEEQARWQELTRWFIRGFDNILVRGCYDLTLSLLMCGAFCMFGGLISRSRSAHCSTGGCGMGITNFICCEDMAPHIWLSVITVLFYVLC